MKKAIIRLLVFTAIISGFVTYVSAVQGNHPYSLPGCCTITVHTHWDRDGTFQWFSTTVPSNYPNIVPVTETTNPNPRTLRFRAQASWLGNDNEVEYGIWGSWQQWVSPGGSTKSLDE